jgi:hypothetical protein
MTEPSTAATIYLTDNTAISSFENNGLRCYFKINDTGNNSLILISNDSFTARVQLSTISGSVIMNKDITIISGVNSIFLDNVKISNGVYILTLKSNYKTISYKIIH